MDREHCLACMVDWAADYIQPITNALYSGKLEEARRLHSNAGQALDKADLPEGVREGLGYYLLLLHYSIHWQEHPADWNQASFQEVRQIFEQPALTSFGDTERIKRLATIRFVADRDKLEPLTHDDLMQLLDELGEATDETMWFYVAGWAYNHNDLELLERAYTETLVDPPAWMGQAKWQRINIMYLLVAGRAERQDVEETIKTLAILPQLYEFEAHIWPKCVEAGLVDDKLTAMLADRGAKIRESATVPRGYEPRTKRVRRDIN